MGVFTDFLNLLKKDPIAEKDDTFNITTMLNDNWDKIDLAVKNLSNQQLTMAQGSSNIPIVGWVSHDGDNALKVNVPITGVVSGNWVDVTIDKEFQDVAQEAEINGTIDEYNGGITVYANTVPSVSIPIRYKVVK